MFVKLSLDEEMSEWLMAVSTNECRSNAQQVLYWLKRIKAGYPENELKPDVTSKIQHVICDDKKGQEKNKKIRKQSTGEQQVEIQEQSNLSTMLEFM